MNMDIFEIQNRPVKIRHQNSSRILHQLQGSSARLVTSAILGKWRVWRKNSNISFANLKVRNPFICTVQSASLYIIACLPTYIVGWTNLPYEVWTFANCELKSWILGHQFNLSTCRNLRKTAAIEMKGGVLATRWQRVRHHNGKISFIKKLHFFCN